MLVAIAFATTSSVLALFVAGLTWGLSGAPGWRDLRWFSLAALAGSAFLAFNVPANFVGSDRVGLAFDQLQLAMASFHLAAWHRYGEAHFRGGGLRSGGRRAALVLAAVGLVALWPGLAYQGLRFRVSEPLGIPYRDPVPTAAGQLLLLALTAGMVSLVARYARAWRRDVPDAGLHLAATGFLLGAGLHDALVVEGLLRTPYLLDLGILGPLAAVAWAMARRVAAQAHALAELRENLESQVGERTLALAQARDDLVRAEKLGALGRFAAGVAHEVNNPASVVTASLQELDRALRAGPLDVPDALECVGDARGAMQRIVHIARQMRDASGITGAAEGGRADVREVVARALDVARSRCPAEISLEAEVPAGLLVQGVPDVLLQVVLAVVVNGIEAIPSGRAGRVRVGAAPVEGAVRVTVADDGTGMPPHVLQRLFEPFFTTKSPGGSAGLSLAVSRALVHGLGGDIAVVSVPGEGTEVRLALRAA